MANSFALTDNGVVLQQPGQAAVVPQTRLTGGGFGQASFAPGGDFALAGQQQADMTARAMDALNTMTQGALQPYVQAQQQKAYFDGMAQVVQGKALQDIEREQPWYTKIFGPSATVQGAQTMAALTAVSQAQSEFMAALPELRKESPDAARQYLTAQAMRISDTGDPLVNGIVQQKLVDQWGAMLSTHMKQHIAWQQEDMGEKFVAMQEANGKLLQATLGEQNGFASPEQMQQEVAKFNDGLLRPVGMEDGAWSKYLKLAAKAQLHGGNFAAYEAMKANPEVWQAIAPEARQDLIDSEALWAARALRDAPALTDITTDQAHLRLAVSQGAFPGDEAKLHAVIDQFNAAFKAQSGSASDMINNAERARLVEQYHKAKAANAGVWARAQAGQLDDQRQRAAVMAAYNGGSSALMPPGIAEENARAASEEFWAAAVRGEGNLDNAISKLALTADERRLRPASLEVQLRQDAHAVFTVGGDLTERQRSSLAVMQKLLTVPGGGPAALGHYIGGDAATKVQAFLNTGVDLSDDKAVLEVRKTFKDGGVPAAVTNADIKAARAAISEQDPGWFTLLLPWRGAGELSALELNDATKARMAADLAPDIARTRKAYPGLSQEVAAADAFAKRYSDPHNVDFVDGTVVPKNPYLSGTQSLFAAVRQLAGFPLSQTDGNYQRALRDVLRSTLKENVARAGGNMVNFADRSYVAAGGEQLGGGVLAMTYYNKDARRTVLVNVTPEQVLRRLQERLAAERVRTPSRRERAEQFAREAAQGKPALPFNRKFRNPNRSLND